MPFSTACSTPLSNFEAGQNYKDVQDPAGEGPGQCTRAGLLWVNGVNVGFGGWQAQWGLDDRFGGG